MVQRTYFYSCSTKNYVKHIKGKLKKRQIMCFLSDKVDVNEYKPGILHKAKFTSNRIYIPD